MKKELDLFMTFFRIGAVTFGGGYAMLPILQKEVVENKAWISQQELMDYYAISQCTPGIIAVNTSIFIGYQVKKDSGGVASALGMVTPSVLIILILATFLQQVMGVEQVQQAFNGIQVAVAVLVFRAALTMMKASLIDKKTIFIFALAVLGFQWVSLSPIIVLIVAASLGILAKGRKST